MKSIKKRISQTWTQVQLNFVALRKKIKASNKNLKLVASIYPAMAGVCLLFRGPDIIKSTHDFQEFVREGYHVEQYNIHWLTFFYWTVLCFWVFIYFMYVVDESATNKERNEDLKSAILRAPNPKIFQIYYEEWKNIVAEVSTIQKNDRKSYEDAFTNVLATICKITSNFINNTDKETIFGANIMFYINAQTHPNKIRTLLSNEAKQSGEWFHFTEKSLDLVNGVLRLVPALKVTNKNKDGSGNRIIPTITIPILTNEKKVLPGAPTAMQTGVFIFSNVDDEKAYSHLNDGDEGDAARRYWKECAKDVKSVFSIRIPNPPKSPPTLFLGVINVDSTKTDIIGNEIAYHPTYYSLIFPVLNYLAPHLEQYYYTYLNEFDTKPEFR